MHETIYHVSLSFPFSEKSLPSPIEAADSGHRASEFVISNNSSVVAHLMDKELVISSQQYY